MKKKILCGVWMVAIALGMATMSYTSRGDIFALTGSGSLRGIDVFRLTSEGDLQVTDSASYTAITGDSTSGELRLGGTQPLFTHAKLPAVLVPFVNGSGTTMLRGTIVLASTAAQTTTAFGTAAAVLATTTVLGCAVDSVAVGATGYLAVAGYALCLTTGAIQTGNIIVTSNTVVGFGGATTGTQVVGTNIGTAVSSGTAAGGLTMVKLR